MERSTVSRLRKDIDSGRTGDKVAHSDPAAAPLGTDDEAAGTPPSSETVARARAQESMDRTPRRRSRTAISPYLIGVLALVAACSLAIAAIFSA